jgi:hypothetical protein
MMELLMMIIVFGLLIYLVYLAKKDIFVSDLKLGIKILGLNLELKAKEKTDPPSESDQSNLK